MYDPEMGVLVTGYNTGALVIQEMLKACIPTLLPHPHVGVFMLFYSISDTRGTPSRGIFSVHMATGVIPGP